MARGAAAPYGSLRAFLRQIRIIVRCRRLWRRQRGKIGTEIANVLIGDLLDDRLHLLVLACAAAEENQLPLDELILLPRQRGDVFGLRDAVVTVTARAQFGLFLPGSDRIGGVS